MSYFGSFALFIVLSAWFGTIVWVYADAIVDSPHPALAWAAFVACVPFVGTIVYLAFGREVDYGYRNPPEGA